MRQPVGSSLLLVLCLVSVTATAQDQFTRIVGAEDNQLSLPDEESPAAQKNDQALQEILNFAQIAHLNRFQDLKGTGQATLAGDLGGPATILVRNGNQFRLDIATPNGVRSICADGVGVNVKHESRVYFSLPPRSAKLTAFFFASALSIDFSQPGLSTVDRGLVTLDEAGALHRITIQVPFAETTADGSVKRTYIPIDFYFNPNTHLLAKAAALVTLSDDSTQQYMRVVTFEDYRQVGGVLVPFRYFETLNGQREWTLQLSQVNVNVGLTSSTFHLDRELADEN